MKCVKLIPQVQSARLSCSLEGDKGNKLVVRQEKKVYTQHHTQQHTCMQRHLQVIKGGPFRFTVVSPEEKLQTQEDIRGDGCPGGVAFAPRSVLQVQSVDEGVSSKV